MGFATLKDTNNFAKKFSNYKDFYIKHNDLIFSKLGLGTFNAEPYKEENYVFHYIEGVKEAVKNGINLVDTASNYRYGQSEKEIGEALKELFEEGISKREELIICSKGGFIQLDYPFPENPYTWIEENIIDKNLAKSEDIELDQHCMTPDFLEYSCRRSIENLGVDALDIYYLHNPEMQLLKLGEKEFYKMVEKVFARFEKLADEGLFNSYGVCVWNGFTAENQELISLEKLLKIAVKVGGENHRFKYIQLPFNMAKTNAYTTPTQVVNKEECTIIQAAHRLNIGVISSSSLLQMKLFKKSFSAETGAVLDDTMTLTSDIQLALQFVRSTPGIISSLFASKVPVHVKENCSISKVKSVDRKRYDLLYRL
ncbi:aldo/keto reductase [Candidatus Sulfurimonas marisnigri]|uniref:Aldo/keto reductase n=1 Tax=Candidatus Sulfurimonas marisnigri TaxID=2740405 RepID=A0A7S7LYG7_9BACT|nr:aldo/keto reductase [Candidatus Sulfurimonas marisnigri]QOY53798.1 aldo/keto reductase [Candidatus Sulfurimonas marisnigri]